jgi:FixJ family two-component response regulator
VQLEDLSGVELIRHLFSLHVLLPVIFMTGIDDELICGQAAALGCVAYLKKPLCQHLLFEAIAEAVVCQTLGRG